MAGEPSKLTDFQSHHLEQLVTEHRFPLLFATISGAHLYGFPSPDSDFDLRGAHVLPLDHVLGLVEPTETIESCGDRAGMEMDLVTHDVKKFFRLMLRKNGYVLEQLLSPLVVHTSPEHEELKSISVGCITKHHAHHYLGFAATQWKLFEKESPPRVKPLLYVFRVLLTGIHLMQSGRIEANLQILNDLRKLSYLPDLLKLKSSGPERGTIAAAECDFYRLEYSRLLSDLEDAYKLSSLPDTPSSAHALSDLLVRIRLKAYS